MPKRSGAAFSHGNARPLLAVATTIAVGSCMSAATADAAVVSVVNGSDYPSRVEPDTVLYAAAPGETNRVTFHVDGDRWTVTDSSAFLTAGEACTAIDAHTVRCGPRPAGPDGAPTSLSWARVSLGDLDDEVSMSAASPGGPFLGAAAMFADGGPGSDRIVGGTGGSTLSGGGGNDELVGVAFGPWLDDLRGGPGDDRLLGGNGFDELDGGGGRDELHGGADDDLLTDGDRDDAAGDAGPGPDLLDGGDGFDTASYSRRSAPVSVDLDDPNGGSGEGDTFTAIEAITGGRGDDRLTGDGMRNVLDGRAGKDRVTGRDGNDVLRNAGRSISCGGGRDTVDAGRSSRDYLPPDCETIAQGVRGPRLPAYPQAVTSRSIRFRIRCPSGDEGLARSICSGKLQLQQHAAPRRRLASGAIGRGLGTRVLIARPTPTGRRLMARPGGVRATVRVAIKAMYSSGSSFEYRWRWSIRLKLSR